MCARRECGLQTADAMRDLLAQPREHRVLWRKPTGLQLAARGEAGAERRRLFGAREAALEQLDQRGELRVPLDEGAPVDLEHARSDRVDLGGVG